MIHAYANFQKGILDSLRYTHDTHVQAERPTYVFTSGQGQERSSLTISPVEGVSMTKQLQELPKEVRDSISRSMTRIRFMALSPNICTAVAIYREGDAFALGYIGHTGEKYYVSHPSIKNEKYKSHKPEYYAITSSGKDHVIKAVRRYCTPVTPSDLCDALAFEVSSQFSKAYMQTTRDLQEAESKLSYSGMALEALTSMLKGETPRPDVVEAVRQYEALKVEAIADIGVSPRLVCFMFNQLKSGVTVTQFRTLYTMNHSRSMSMFIRKTGDAAEDRRTSQGATPSR